MSASRPTMVALRLPAPNVTVTPAGAATPPKSSAPLATASVSVIGRVWLFPSTALETAPN